MKKCWHALAGGMVAFACASAMAQQRPWTAEELYDRLAPSIWLVETQVAEDKRSIGSAVVIAPGRLITNCHVLEKARVIAVSHMERDRRRVPARLEYRDPSRDLCQLHAPGVLAPAVQMATTDSLRPGAKVYAIGNPRGLELTISDGLLSGLRRDGAGELQRIQISVPISPGSSGGGLFDVHGRLIGITTSGLVDSQNLNFALPADWIAELGPRARGEPVTRIARAAPPRPVEARPEAPAPAPIPSPAPSPPASAAIAAIVPTPAPPSPAPVQTVPLPALLASARVFEYELRDRLTGLARAVVFRIDRREGDRLVINGGARIEQADGRVIVEKDHIAGEFDAAMPPGGWIHEGNLREKTWTRTYQSPGDGRPFRMEIRAEQLGEEVVVLKGQALNTLRIRYKGYTSRGAGTTNNPPGTYTATAWYAPQLGRVVRFEARSRGGLGHAAFMVDEVLELVDLRAE